MNRIFSFPSNARPYIADAAVLQCFDHRMANAISELLRTQGIEQPDTITVAGGAKALASPGNAAEREFVLEQVRLSIRLHQSKRVLLVAHADCGAYGGLARFSGDRAAERAFHESELEQAAELVIADFPDVSVNAFFIDFDGVWRL